MKILSPFWLLAGSALTIWSVIELWQIGNNKYLGINSGAFEATLIALGFGCASIVGTIGLLLKTNWGRMLILFSSGLSLIYAAAYLLLGGFEDTGPIYAVAVSSLVLLSIASFAILGRKEKFKNWQLNKPIEADRE